MTQNEEMSEAEAHCAGSRKNDSPTIIYGETGTGKELVAEALHTLSSRKNRPLFHKNCAAIPSNLLESLFFGTEKGWFYWGRIKKAF